MRKNVLRRTFDRKHPESFFRVAILSAAFFFLYGLQGDKSGPPVNAISAEREGRLFHPLIYFSREEPAGNEAVRREIAEDLQLSPHQDMALVFGENRIGDMKVLIVRGERETANRFDNVSQLFTFLVNNGWHSKKLNYSYEGLTERLFYRSQPLELTCGKFSTYLSALAEEKMGVHPKHIRSVTNYDERWRKGHTFREIYFPELHKWVLLDVDTGLIPVLDGEPLSTLELSLAGDREYEKAVQSGLNAYGRKGGGSYAAENDIAKRTEAKRYADRLWKTRRKNIAIKKRHRFTRCSPSEYTLWKKKAERNRKITVSCNPEEVRARFYPEPRRDGVPNDVSMSSRAPWTYPATGFFRREFFAEENIHATWTGGAARIPTVLLGQPRDVMMLLTLRGAPSAVTDRALSIAVNDRRIAERTSPTWEDGFQTIELAIEANVLKQGANTVEIGTTTWQASDVLGTVDNRKLGVLLASVKWRPASREEVSDAP